MSATPEHSTDAHPPPSAHTAKSQRVLACVLCQQRKVKCDRKFPCAHCVKARVQCVPATLATRRRRRQFPERELLDRLRRYESLLQQNKVKFEPLSQNAVGDKSAVEMDIDHDSGDEPSPSTTTTVTGSDKVYETKNVWRALKKGSRDSEHDSDSSSDEHMSSRAVAKAWDLLFWHDDHLSFGTRTIDVDLYTLHPEPAQIFRLWQIYLENVNPLLKVTHTPTLQGRIVEAVGNVASINPTLEALMFSIYCMALRSLVASDVRAMFGASKEDLLSQCLSGCRQALSNCRVLQCDDRDCLTAFFLYLNSVRSNTLPRSLSSMLGVALRIAQRMGMHSESELAKCTALEAEMRRRLWWALVLFDTRIGELADYKTTHLVPTWDCRIPLNVNDSDLRPDMKRPPEVMGVSTEAFFVVMRGRLGDFVRNTTFYLDFTNPSLKPIAEKNPAGPVASECGELERIMEEGCLKSYDEDNPLHFVTVWTARYFIARYRLMEIHAEYLNSSTPPTDAQRDTAIAHASDMLDCDTKLAISPLTKGYFWFHQLYFPMLAYLQILPDLKRRPLSPRAMQAWRALSDNYDGHFCTATGKERSFLIDAFKPVSFFHHFAQNVIPAWEARELALKQTGEADTLPGIVTSIREELAATILQNTENRKKTQQQQQHDIAGMDIDDLLASLPADYDSHIYSLEGQVGYAGMSPETYPPPLAPTMLGPRPGMNPLNWPAMNWNPMARGMGFGAWLPGPEDRPS